MTRALGSVVEQRRPRAARSRPGLLRVPRVLRQGATVAALVLVGASWLSVSASASTGDPSGEPSPDSSSSPSPSSEPSSESEPPSPQSCATSQGAYPFPVSGTSRYALPGWVSSPDSHVCVLLDASGLVDLQETSPPAPVLSQSLEPTEGEADLLAEVKGFRALVLCSGGLLIFLLAGLFFRSRNTT